MKTIHKHPIQTTDCQTIEIPFWCNLLTVQAQHGTPCIWAEVETTDTMSKLHIRTFGTGHEIPEDIGQYPGTYQLEGGSLVFHVYIENAK